MKMYSVAQNASILTSAFVLQKVISFLYFSIIARLVGVENTGVYFFAIIFTTIFLVVGDFGFATVLTRETAKYPANAEKYFNTVLWTKFIFGLVALASVAIAAKLLNYPAETRLLIYVSGFTMFFDNFHSGFYGIFRANKNLSFEAIGIIVSQIITMIIGTFALINHWPLVWLILAYTIPSALNVLYSGYFVHRIYQIKFSFNFDPKVFKFFIALAWPFFVAGIVGRLYSYSDSLLMSKMLSAKELGWWSVPYKITYAFQFIPAALSASVYPAMSAYTVDGANKAKIGELFEKSWRYLFTIVFPLVFGLGALAYPITVYFYGANYAPSAPVLQILLASLVFGFLGFITGAILNATNRQLIQTGLLALVLVVSVVLNIFLLPIFGIMGAAYAALICNIILCLGGYYFANRYVKLDHVRLIKYANQSFWPALVMGIVVLWLSSYINFLFTIPIGVVVYFSLLFLTGGIDRAVISRIVSKVRI